MPWQHRQAGHRFQQHRQGQLWNRGRFLRKSRHPDNHLWAGPYRAGTSAGRMDRGNRTGGLRPVYPPPRRPPLFAPARLILRCVMGSYTPPAPVPEFKVRLCRPDISPWIAGNTGIAGITTRDSGQPGTACRAAVTDARQRTCRRDRARPVAAGGICGRPGANCHSAFSTWRRSIGSIRYVPPRRASWTRT